MKINAKEMSYEEVLALPRLQHKTPMKPQLWLATIARIICEPALRQTKFSYTTERMELVKDQPCLILMNHSSFTDMKLAYGIFYPQKLGIVTSVDAMTGLLGKLMRLLGCTPTRKYISDMSLIKDINYMLKENKTSVLMYPEAGYSFDGCATTMPKRLGVLLKKLGVPVVTVITQGAFHRDPLYNMLQIRDVKVSAHVKCIATAEEVKEKSVEELDALLAEAFSFDNFAWQRDNRISVDVPFRADGLHRILYKCPHCGTENRMEGKGIHLTCHACEKQWTMDEYGQLSADEGETEFSHTLYSDYYWYEIGDMIGIGDNEFSYFCFPKENISVSKARLATEELYKLKKKRKK